MGKPFKRNEKDNLKIDKFDKSDYLPYDLSFIPRSTMSKQLKNFEGTKIISPYGNTEVNIENLIAQNKYHELDQLLREFADEQYQTGNIELAKKAYELLLELGTKISSNKENLLKIYLNERNENGIERVKIDLYNQMKETTDYNYQQNKIKRIINVYFRSY
ncbi:hypothetical protein CEH05_03355 [Halobacillus halophilus]|uniref:Uncharacterized protein n=1 Tax=Halobacillus halophilus (strain ATCC 35676 / DSM 2266 / JCM 20832 / KCTC 3685 / LMG 17431 / NBRC 102448 / NCIMB 2269) TaxID=866895 RepID=I0JIP8_HALH3|nr:hypothetical protein [Halobacillus halophilus]ASF38197.1 hypothetical protein CEH05_03355 [Halobacillus halophilus]CCG44016.1 hypothetical protein HBHAL_1649 [Halobacillus halophilus DSM 2266]